MIASSPVGAIGFVWYTNKKSRKYSASKTVMAAKGILLLVNGCQNYKDIEGGYLMALKLLADFTVTDGMDVLEAKIVALSKVWLVDVAYLEMVLEKHAFVQ